MSQARMMLYSIVNTLTGLVSADSVRFLIEGEVISSYGGIPLLEPLSRDASLIFGA
jgi:spore germination protein GerM